MVQDPYAAFARPAPDDDDPYASFARPVEAQAQPHAPRQTQPQAQPQQNDSALGDYDVMSGEYIPDDGIPVNSDLTARMAQPRAASLAPCGLSDIGRHLAPKYRGSIP